MGVDASTKASVIDATPSPVEAPTPAPNSCHEKPTNDEIQVAPPPTSCFSVFDGSQDPFNLVDASTLALMHETCNADPTQATSLLGQPVMVEIGRKMSAVGSRKFCRPASTPVVDADALLLSADL